jgi:hypothetical protein
VLRETGEKFKRLAAHHSVVHAMAGESLGRCLVFAKPTHEVEQQAFD